MEYPFAGSCGIIPDMKMGVLSFVSALAVASIAQAGAVVSAEGLAGDGTVPCADAIQRLIDANPNREIFFPDGTYLLDKPICTPADPAKSVSLKLSTYAKFKAAPGWTNTEAMVRLGAIHPANNIWLPGSWYWLKGGIIDGSGVANGVSIDGGRETLIADVSMKAVRIGLHIKRGANSGSSDADIRNVNIVCNRAEDSIGVLVDGYDNTLANMRIYGARRGVVINAGGNMLRDIHPLFAMDHKMFPRSVGFEINAVNVWMDFCYSDQHAVGFKFGKRGTAVMDKCFCMWYKTGKGMRATVLSAEGSFNAKVNNLTVGFNSGETENVILAVGESGGNGYLRDLNGNFHRANDPARTHEKYLR